MGWFFSNAHIRKAGSVSQEAVETVMRRTLEQMGYQRAAQQDADTVLYVFEGEQWFSICSELMHYGGQEDMKQTAAHLSRELGSDALAIACIDSDVVLLNLVNVAEGADAWADAGDGSCWGIQQRGIVGPWKEKVTDLDRFQQLLQDKALSPEEILAQVSPLLGLDSEQGFFCPDMVDREARQNLRTCYFKRTVAAEAEELPRLELYLPSLQPVKMGDPNTVSVVNRGGSSQGVAVLFSGAWVEKDEITLRNVSLTWNLSPETGGHETVSLALEKRPCSNGSWCYYAEVSDFAIPDGVPQNLQGSRLIQKKEFERHFSVHFTPEGNDRKRLGVFVHIIPLANQMKGQAVWYAWHLCQTPREYLEENNRRFANTGMWSAFWLDPSDFDLEESE